MKIWCLFSVVNDYDQPENNLVAWWETKPDGPILARHIGYEGFPHDWHEDRVLAIKRLHDGKVVRLDQTDYRLEQLGPGVVPSRQHLALLPTKRKRRS